jgi:hypothetical protein
MTGGPVTRGDKGTDRERAPDSRPSPTVQPMTTGIREERIEKGGTP